MILMTDRIVICKAIKNKQFSYELIINHNNTGRNVIQARSFDKRSRGIKGEVKANEKNITWQYKEELKKHLTTPIRKKIEFAIEMVYGKDGSKVPEVHKGKLKIDTSKENERRLLESYK